MSTSVDTRLVQMRFDNKDFQDKIAGTLKSLDNLEKALQLKGCDAGFEKITSAMNAMSFDGVESSLDHLTNAFSVKGAVILSIISKFTNQAYDLVMSKLKVIPNFITEALIEGGKRRAANTDQAKFLINNIIDSDAIMKKGEKNIKKLNDFERKIYEAGSAWDFYQDAFNNAVQDTAYGLDQAAKAGSGLIAAGLKDAKDVEKTLLTVAGVAATANADYDRIANYFTKMKSLGKFTGDISRSLTELGIPAEDVVYKYWKKTTKASKKGKDEFKKEMQKGNISFDLAEKALEKEYAKSAKKANETYEGAMSNLRAAFAKIGQQFFQPWRETMRVLFLAMKDIVNAANKTLKPWIKSFMKSVDEVFGNLSERLDYLKNTSSWNGLIDSVYAMGRSMSEAAKAAVPFFKQILNADNFIGILKVIARFFNIIGKVATIFFNSLSEGFRYLSSNGFLVINALLSIEESAIRVLNSLSSNFSEGLGRIFTNIFKAIDNIATMLVNTIVPVVTGFFSSISNNSLDDFVGSIADFTDILPKLTAGLIPSGKTMENLYTIGKGLADVFGIILDVISMLIPDLSEMDVSIGGMSEGFFEFIANIARGISWLRDYLKTNTAFQKAIKKFQDIISKVKKLLIDMKDKLSGLWTKVFGDHNVIEVLAGAFILLFNKAKQALDYLYDQFVKLTGKTPKEALQSILDFIKEFPDKFNDFWKSITGEDFGDWVKNTGDKIIEFFGKLKDKLGDFVEKVRTETLPKIGENIKSFFDSIRNGTLKDDLTTKAIDTFTKIIDFFKQLASGEINIDTIKSKLSELGGGVTDLLGNVFEKIGDFIEKIPELKEDAEEKISNAIEFLQHWFPVLLKVFVNLTNQMVKMNIAKALKTFADATKNFSKYGLTMATAAELGEIAKVIGLIILAIVVVVAAIWAVKKMLEGNKLATEEAVKIVVTILGLILAFTAAMFIGTAALLKSSKGNPNSLNAIVALGKSLESIFAAIAIIIAAIVALSYVVSKMNKDQIDSVVTIISVVFGALLLLVVVMGAIIYKLSTSHNALDVAEAGAAFKSIAYVLAAFGAALILITAAMDIVFKMITKDPTAFEMAASVVAIIGVVLVALIAILTFIVVEVANYTSGMDVAETAILMGVIAGMLIVFAGVVGIMAYIIKDLSESSSDLSTGLSAFKTIVLMIAGVLALVALITGILGSMNGMASAPVLLGVLAGVMIAMAASVWIIADALVKLKDIPINQIQDSLTAIGVFMFAMIALVAVLAAVGAATEGTFAVALLLTAAALLAIGAAVWLVADGILRLAQGFNIAAHTLMDFIDWWIALLEYLTPEKMQELANNFDNFIPILCNSIINALPYLHKVFVAILGMLTIDLPLIVGFIFEVLNAFMAKFWNFLTIQLRMFGAWIGRNYQTIMNLIAVILDGVIELVIGRLSTLFTSILQLLSEQVEPLATLITEILNALAEHAEEWTKALVEIVFGVVIGVIDGLAEKIPDLLESIYNFIISLLDALANFLSKDKAKDLKSHINKTAKAIIGFFEECFGMGNASGSSFGLMGIALMGDLVDGMADKISKSKKAITDVGKTVLNTFKKSLEEKSPSKATKQMGEFLSEGLAIGIKKSAKKVYDQADDTGRGTLSSLEDALAKVPDILKDNIDMNPTIKPVLDLSDVIDKSSILDNLLSTDQAHSISLSEGLKSKVDEFTSDSENQNGTSGNVYFTQNNYSPKSLSRKEIYRDTKNMISTRGKGLVT